MKLTDLERSIIKKYKKDIFSKFVRGINDYNMIKENDKIAVCISGGKDSFLLAKCMQELKRHGKFNFELEFIAMDPGYNENNRKLIISNAEKMNIPIKIFNTDIFEIVDEAGGSPCYLCARMRRGSLYSMASKLGCNKIALGHHFDDVIETTLLSMLYGGEFKTMMPKLHSTNFENMELIRPLYLVKEKSIKAWVNYNDLNFLNCACKFTEKENYNETDSKRLEMKNLIGKFREISPYIDMNIFRSAENVNLNTIISYYKDDEKHCFLDEYESKK